MLSQAATSFLFFVRVKAVCSDSKIIVGFFIFAWVANLGISVLVPLSIEADVSLPSTCSSMHHIHILFAHKAPRPDKKMYHYCRAIIRYHTRPR